MRIGFWVDKAALRFRAGLVCDPNAYQGGFNWDETMFKHYDVPLLRREAHHLSIRWPTEKLSYYSPASTRGVLNKLLIALDLRTAYHFTITHGDVWAFWARDGAALTAKGQGKWRNQHLEAGDWYPLIEGELARMALNAERKLMRKQATITLATDTAPLGRRPRVSGAVVKTVVTV